MKTLNIVFMVQECDANEVELCFVAWLIKNKNKNMQALLAGCERFTEKIKHKIAFKTWEQRQQVFYLCR